MVFSQRKLLTLQKSFHDRMLLNPYIHRVYQLLPITSKFQFKSLFCGKKQMPSGPSSYRLDAKIASRHAKIASLGTPIVWRASFLVKNRVQILGANSWHCGCHYRKPVLDDLNCGRGFTHWLAIGIQQYRGVSLNC